MKTKYFVRVFDYGNGWYIDSKHYNFLPAQCNRINKRRKGEFAIVTYKQDIVNAEVPEKLKEEPEGT